MSPRTHAPAAAEVLLPAHRHPVPTRTRLRTARLPVALYLAVVLLVPAAVLTAGVAGGWWRTTGGTLTASTAAPAAERPATPAAPADVRGSMTVQEVVEAFPAVTVADVLAAFGAPAGTPGTTQLKTLVEDGAGMDVPAFRSWLESRSG